MLGRFFVRPSENNDGTFGVWDGAVNGWRGRGLTEQAAGQVKADLDVQFNAHGPRPAHDVRRTDPAKPVEYVAAWQPGELDAWIREDGRWLGRVRDSDGQITWIPSTDLRPAARD